jgi:hypothetical protein
MKKQRRLVRAEISEAERGQLLSVIGQPGYQVILDIMERACIRAETDHFRLSRARGATAEMVLASHDIAQAQRIFFENVQRIIEAQRMAGAPPPAVPKEPFERTYERSLTGQ